MSTRESEKAEKALEAYKFLFWLDKFIYIREGRSNVPRDNSFSNDDEDENDGYASNEYFSDENKAMTRKKKTTLKTVELLPSYHLLIVEPAPLHPLPCRQKKNTTSSKRKADTSNQAANKKKGKG